MPRRRLNLSLSTQDIPGAQARKTLKVAGVKKSNFFPEMPQIEMLLTKDKRMRGSSFLSAELDNQGYYN